jgi:hypothetical protein
MSKSFKRSLQWKVVMVLAAVVGSAKESFLAAAGDIGFRQHTDGHTNGPTWPTFLTFADKYSS